MCPCSFTGPGVWSLNFIMLNCTPHFLKLLASISGAEPFHDLPSPSWNHGATSCPTGRLISTQSVLLPRFTCQPCPLPVNWGHCSLDCWPFSFRARP